jgi:hypothetical protein
LITYKPFHYLADMGVDVGVTFDADWWIVHIVNSPPFIMLKPELTLHKAYFLPYWSSSTSRGPRIRWRSGCRILSLW